MEISEYINTLKEKYPHIRIEDNGDMGIGLYNSKGKNIIGFLPQALDSEDGEGVERMDALIQEKVERYGNV